MAPAPIITGEQRHCLNRTAAPGPIQAKPIRLRSQAGMRAPAQRGLRDPLLPSTTTPAPDLLRAAPMHLRSIPLPPIQGARETGRLQSDDRDRLMKVAAAFVPYPLQRPAGAAATVPRFQAVSVVEEASAGPTADRRGHRIEDLQAEGEAANNNRFEIRDWVPGSLSVSLPISNPLLTRWRFFASLWIAAQAES